MTLFDSGTHRTPSFHPHPRSVVLRRRRQTSHPCARSIQPVRAARWMTSTHPQYPCCTPSPPTPVPRWTQWTSNRLSHPSLCHPHHLHSLLHWSVTLCVFFFWVCVSCLSFYVCWSVHFCSSAAVCLLSVCVCRDVLFSLSA